MGPTRTDAARTTVVTRTKNRPIMLERALRSVCGQTDAALVDWVVVNDGGDPGPVDAITAKASVNTQVVHHTASKGMEAASNAGIALAQSTYLAVHDDDDTWLPGFVAETTSFLEANRWCAGVISGTEFVHEEIRDGAVHVTGTEPWRPGLRDAPTGAVQIADMAVINQFPPISFLYRCEALSETGTYDETLPVLGDWEFNLRFLAKFEIGVLDRVLARYHCRPAAKSDPYGNSVGTGVDLHRRHDALVRNRIIRSATSPEDVRTAVLLATGHVHGAMITQAHRRHLEVSATQSLVRRDLRLLRLTNKMGGRLLRALGLVARP